MTTRRSLHRRDEGDDDQQVWEQAAGSAEQFSPTQVSAVSAWLRLASGTITGAGYSSVPDILASNPAVQTTDVSRPPNLNSANALPRADFDGASDYLSWPAAANNNQTVTSGFAAWCEFDFVSAIVGIFAAFSGATTRCELFLDGNDLCVNVNHSQFSVRRGTVADCFVAATKYFVTWEYDGGGANDAAKCTLTINGAVQSVTFVNDTGAPNAMPATLVATAGPFLIGTRLAAVGPLDGKIGPNIFILGSKMAGATQGLLTTAARAALMNFEAPT